MYPSPINRPTSRFATFCTRCDAEHPIPCICANIYALSAFSRRRSLPSVGSPESVRSHSQHVHAPSIVLYGMRLTADGAMLLLFLEAEDGSVSLLRDACAAAVCASALSGQPVMTLLTGPDMHGHERAST